MTGKNTRFKKGNLGKPKGAKNRFTKLKDDILTAYESTGRDELGGVDFWRILKRKHSVDFAKITAGLLPKEIRAEIGEPIHVIIKYVRLNADGNADK